MRRVYVLGVVLSGCFLPGCWRDSGDRVWSKVQLTTFDAVVHVVAQVAEFNWIKPYETRKQSETSGSGFFINAEGDMVTNAHVVLEAKRLWIHIPSLGQKPLMVNIVGIAPERDIALLRLSDEDRKVVKDALGTIPFLSLGNSDRVRSTDRVLVLGYPLGQYHVKSATGIVSGREFLDGQSYLQTTAPINAGNSGGPLLAVDGTVIGVNSAAISSAQNVGYALPVNEVKGVLDALATTSFLRNPMLGIQFNNASEFHAQFLGNPAPGGLYINKAYKGLLADMHGVKMGDMLYRFNGYALDVYGDARVPWSETKVSLPELISRLALGDEVTMQVYRDGKLLEIKFPFSLKLYPICRRYPDYEPIDYEVIGGMVIMPLAENHLKLLEEDNPQLVRYQRMENRREPVLVVVQILPGSLAKKVRSLHGGDILESVNGIPVKTLDDFRNALKKGVATKSLAVKTDEGVVAVFSLQEVLAQEQQLAKDFDYSVSKSITLLNEMMQHGTEKKTRPARA